MGLPGGGTFRPSRSIVSGPARGFLKVKILDRITPALLTAAGIAEPMTSTGFEVVAQRMEMNIKRRFYEGPRVWPALKPSTIAWKARHGIPWPAWTLRETLTLQQNVNRLKVRVRKNVSGTSGRLSSATLTIPERTFWGSPYVIFHELGWGQTKRSFIAEGIYDTYKEVETAIVGTMGKLWSIMQRPDREGIPWREIRAGGADGGGFAIIPFATMPLRGFIMGLLVPPSSLWAVFGAVSDIRGLLRGQFTPEMIAAFMRNWGLGQFGLTAKVQRRRLRRGIWSRR